LFRNAVSEGLFSHFKKSMAFWPGSSGKENESNTDPIDSRDVIFIGLRVRK